MRDQRRRGRREVFVHGEESWCSSVVHVVRDFTAAVIIIVIFSSNFSQLKKPEMQKMCLLLCLKTRTIDANFDKFQLTLSRISKICIMKHARNIGKRKIVFIFSRRLFPNCRSPHC